jgi:hypothetical protein
MHLTPERIMMVFTENREGVLEQAADGQVLVMTPTGCPVPPPLPAKLP